MDGTAENPQGTSRTPSGGGTTGTAEQRRQYRVSSGLDGMLTFAVILGDGKEHRAELVDVSAGGACLRWPQKNLVVLEVGQRIQLRVKSSMATTTIILDATVRWFGVDDEGNVRYGVEFHDMEEKYDQIPAALRWLFNRRRAPR